MAISWLEIRYRIIRAEPGFRYCRSLYQINA